jgi:ATP-dependent DNA helicase RecQ
LRYFGDERETLHGCGRCDVCMRIGAGDSVQDGEHVALVVRKALSGIARVHGRFGLHMAARLLRGVDDPRLERQGLAQTRTFGVLASHSEEWIIAVLRRCASAGWIDFSGGDRPVVLLTAAGKRVMKGEAPARLLLPDDELRPARRSDGASRAAAPIAVDVDPAGLALFEALRRYRLERARADSVPPYVVASDRTLREVALMRPRTLDQLGMAHGIGPAKLERYGQGLLAVVAEHHGIAEA